MNVYYRDNPVWFLTAVESILNQTMTPDEVVLVVDGPVPHELDVEIARLETDGKIRVIRLAENQGLGNARRVGLENCRNELVAMMNADDICMPDRFEKQIARFSEEQDLDIVGGNISEFIGDPENIVGYRLVPRNHIQLSEYIKKRCPFNHMTVMLKKTSAQKVGSYLDWHYNEDYYLWIRMYLNGMRFGNVPEIVVNVRVGKEMYKRRGGWKYFKSELGLQNLMLKKRLIGFPQYVFNVLIRVFIQLLIPNSLRGLIFKKFARVQSVKPV